MPKFPIIFSQPCPNLHCESEVEFSIEPYTSANTSGPPDRWYPAEGGYADPVESKCPNCLTSLEDEKYLERIYDLWENRNQDNYEGEDD